MLRKIVIVALYILHLLFMLAYIVMALVHLALQLGAPVHYIGKQNANNIMNSYSWSDHIIHIAFSMAMFLGVHFLYKRKDYAVHCYLFGCIVYLLSGTASNIYWSIAYEGYFFDWLDLVRFAVVIALARLV